MNIESKRKQHINKIKDIDYVWWYNKLNNKY